MDNGWKVNFLAKSREMFHTHSEKHPAQVTGILNDVIYSDVYGEGNS